MLQLTTTPSTQETLRERWAKPGLSRLFDTGLAALNDCRCPQLPGHEMHPAKPGLQHLRRLRLCHEPLLIANSKFLLL